MAETEKGAYQKAICPKCKKEINFATKGNIDYTPSKANSRVRCRNCGTLVVFSLKKEEN